MYDQVTNLMIHTVHDNIIDIQFNKLSLYYTVMQDRLYFDTRCDFAMLVGSRMASIE